MIAVKIMTIKNKIDLMFNRLHFVPSKIVIPRSFVAPFCMLLQLLKLIFVW